MLKFIKTLIKKLKGDYWYPVYDEETDKWAVVHFNSLRFHKYAYDMTYDEAKAECDKRNS